MFSSQPTRNQTPVVSSVPEVGVVSSHPKDWLVHNDFQHQESASSNSQQQTYSPSSDATDGGIHVYVHSVDGLSIHGEESEEEVSFAGIKRCIYVMSKAIQIVGFVCVAVGLFACSTTGFSETV